MAAATPFRFVTFNVDQARREEQVPGKTWNERVGGVLDVIRTAKPDIMCIQEMRNLETSNMTVDEFVAVVTRIYPELAAVPAYYNDTKFSFAGAVFYNRYRFRFLGSGKYHYNADTGNPEHMRSHLEVELVEIATKKKLSVVNVHTPLPEDAKWEAIDVLFQEFGEPYCHSDGGQIFSGDWNFFDDKDGHAMRAKMEQLWTDAAFPLVHRVDETETVLSGTFFGYAHDEFHKQFDAMSRLDHVYVNKHVAKQGNAFFINKDNAPLPEDRSYPSDHVCIGVDFILA